MKNVLYILIAALILAGIANAGPPAPTAPPSVAPGGGTYQYFGEYTIDGNSSWWYPFRIDNLPTPCNVSITYSSGYFTNSYYSAPWKAYAIDALSILVPAGYDAGSPFADCLGYYSNLEDMYSCVSSLAPLELRIEQGNWMDIFVWDEWGAVCSTETQRCGSVTFRVWVETLEYPTEAVIFNTGFEMGAETYPWEEWRKPRQWWPWGYGGWSVWKQEGETNPGSGQPEPPAHSGSRYIAVGGFGSDYHIKAQCFEASEGDVLEFSAWARTEDWGDPVGGLLINYKDINNQVIRGDSLDVFTGDIDTTWRKYTLISDPVPAGVAWAETIFVGGPHAYSTGGSILFDDASLIKSTDAHRYKPNPDPIFPIERLAMWEPDGNGSGSWQPVYPDEIESGNVHVVVHGWGNGLREWVDGEDGLAKIWEHPTAFENFQNVAESIGNSYNLSDDYHILAYTWVDQSATPPFTLEHPEYPAQSRSYTDVAGLNLKLALGEAGIDSSFNGQLHLLGHSHGSRVITIGAIELEDDGIDVDHLTYWDSPETASIQDDDLYKDSFNDLQTLFTELQIGTGHNETFIDNYITLFGTPYCYQKSDGLIDIDLGAVNPDGIGSHGYPLTWYSWASGYTTPEYEKIEAIWWSPLKGSLYQNIEPGYERLGCCLDDRHHLTEQNLCTAQSTTSTNELVITSSTTEGEVTETSNSVQLTESSPAFWNAVFVKSEDDLYIQFDYQFLAVGDGDELGVWVDDKLKFIMPGITAGTDKRSSTIGISGLEPGEHVLTVALHDFGEANADILVSNIKMVSKALNSPPIANAGQDQTVSVGSDCTATVTLDGSGSSDVDGDSLSYSWSMDGVEIATGVGPTITLPLGIHTIELIANDSTTDSEADEVVITVEDTTGPVLTCPADVVLECPADTSVEANGSATATDNCDDSPVITHEDEVIPGIGDNETIIRSWTATDTAGNSSSCEQIIFVEDSIAPEISVSVEPGVLWPPNHKMIEISTPTSASDDCDDSPIITLQSITMNEGEETDTYDPGYDDTLGDGHTIDDIQVDADGTIYLRAERSGKGDGRVYTITYEVEDASGNTSEATATVTVPHNQP